MSLRADLLPVFNDVRTLIDSGLGMRTTRVLIRKRVFVNSADRSGKGPYTDTDTEIEPRPKVEDVAGVGAMGRGAFRISKITPSHTGATIAGYTPAELLQRQPPGTVVFVVLLGPGSPRECTIVALNETKNFEYVMDVEDRK